MLFASRGKRAMTKRLGIICLVAAAIYTSCAVGADPDKGKRLFMSVGCFACHGTVGQGATATGPRLAPNPLPLEAFLQELRSPRNVMPPYAASVLPDDAIADIRAYLATIPSPPPRP